ncbi:hypothetical protein AURDEDRAFT_173927 [Auricularia subglabra TFB-10046 SS5]|uniref:Uncharacterized protein n=1 Tax=Auricularia subglabra (strain TFB-10046 / SS5) TaxID=717982 RepID=J0CZC3_AURST|nr:hypothetical protein AURDEDRAFT_173927 [Auricularia subglabra TFB-10046 SS5]
MSATALPVELAEQIIDCLSEDRCTLLACSKVARGWQSRALSYLFCSIQIRDPSFTVFSLGHVLVFGTLYFAGFQVTMPHLLLYLRHLTFVGSHHDSATLTLARNLRIPPPCALDSLTFIGDENWLHALDDLAARIPNLGKLRLQRTRHYVFDSLPLFAAPVLDIAMSEPPTRLAAAMSQLRLRRRPPTLAAQTKLTTLIIRIPSDFNLFRIGEWISAAYRRAPSLQSIVIVQTPTNWVVIPTNWVAITEQIVLDFIASIGSWEHLIHSLQLCANVWWENVSAFRYNSLLGHLSRLRELIIVVPRGVSPRDTVLKLTAPLEALEHMEVVIDDANPPLDIGMLCDWTSLEDILLLHCPRFRRLTLAVALASGLYATTSLNAAIRDVFASHLPRLHQDGKLYTVVKSGRPWRCHYSPGSRRHTVFASLPDMSSGTIIPANPADDWTTDGAYRLLQNICLDSDSSGPAGLMLYADTFILWNETFHGELISLRAACSAHHSFPVATTVWINYWDSASNGDADFALIGGGKTTVLLASNLDVSQELMFYIHAPADSLRAFVFSSLQFTVETPSVIQTSESGTAAPGYVPSTTSISSAPFIPSVPSASNPSAPDTVPPTGNSHSHTVAIIGGIVAGVLATAAFLVAVLWLRHRRRKNNARPPAAGAKTAYWTDYARRTTAPGQGAAFAHSFSPVPTQDPDKRDPTLFDASIALQSMALYDTMRSSATDSSTVPLLSKDAKREEPFDNDLPPELVDQIIDELAGDRPALFACSMLARVWRPRALVHLFYSIRVVQANGPNTDSDPDGTLNLHSRDFQDLRRRAAHLLSHLRFLALEVTTTGYHAVELMHIARTVSPPTTATVTTLKLVSDSNVNWNGLLDDLPARFPALRRLELETQCLFQLDDLAQVASAAREIVFLRSPWHKLPALLAPVGPTVLPNLCSLEILKADIVRNDRTFEYFARICACSPNLQRVVVRKVTQRALQNFFDASSPFSDKIQVLGLLAGRGRDHKLLQDDLDAALSHCPNLRELEIELESPTLRIPLPSSASSLDTLRYIYHDVARSDDATVISCDARELEDLVLSSQQMSCVSFTFVLSDHDETLFQWDIRMGTLVRRLLPGLWSAGKLACRAKHTARPGRCGGWTGRVLNLAVHGFRD